MPNLKFNKEERIFDEAELERQRDEEFLQQLRQNFPLADGEIPQSETLKRYDPELHGKPAVFVIVSRTRDSLSDEQFNDICKEQRVQLIESMLEDHMVTHTIVAQDNIGFTLLTEINLFIPTPLI